MFPPPVFLSSVGPHSNKDSAFKLYPCSQCQESGSLQLKDSRLHSLETWAPRNKQLASLPLYKHAPSASISNFLSDSYRTRGKGFLFVCLFLKLHCNYSIVTLPFPPSKPFHTPLPDRLQIHGFFAKELWRSHNAAFSSRLNTAGLSNHQRRCTSREEK